MDEMSVLGQKESGQAINKIFIITELNGTQIHQRVVKKSKKECLKEKKRVKNMELEQSKTDKSQLHFSYIKTKEDQDNSLTTQEPGVKKIKSITGMAFQRPIHFFEGILHKPPYISIHQDNRILGDFGHASAIFKRPIIQGYYFLEVEIKENQHIEKKIKNKPSVRLGICKHDYNPIFPIGGQDSIAYKSSDGSFVSNYETLDQEGSKVDSYGYGDVIGILVNISPPHKTPNPKKINQGSTVSFFKNGKLVYEYKSLKQIFYCFAVGFYNYSKVQILDGPHSRFPLPFQAKHYYEVINEPILYKNLEQNRLFKV